MADRDDDEPPRASAPEPETPASKHAVPTMPAHPARWLHRTFSASGAGILAIAALENLAHLDVGLAVVLGLGGATHLLIGRYGQRVGPGMQLVHAAANQVAIGRLDVATALLERAETRYGLGAVRREAHLVRARIALDRGDPEAALAEAERALAIGSGPVRRRLEKQATWLPRLSALSMRAFCRAVTGDAAGARADIAAVDALLAERGSSLGARPAAFLGLEGARTLREPFARAKLAEAILLAQEGDRGKLRSLVTTHARLFAEGAPPRERALVRGFERMLASPASTAYRRTTTARRSADEALDEEDWIERVLPEVAPFVREASAAETDERVAAPAARRPDEAPAAIDWGPAKRIAATVGVWVGLVAAMAGLWFATGQDRAANPSELLLAVTIGLPALFVVALVALSAMRVRSLSTRSRRLLDRLVGVARAPDDEVRGELEAIAQTSDPIIGGQARLALAELHARAGDFEASAEQAARALSRLERRLMRAVASDALIPSLRAARALAHAALGRVDDARSEVEALGDDYASRGRAVFSVELVAFANEGALLEAARLAEARPPGVSLDRPVEVLADLVRATHAPAGLGLAEAQRLERDLADPSVRRWLERAAPRALEAFEERAPAEPATGGERVRIAAAPSGAPKNGTREAEELEADAIADALVDEATAEDRRLR